MELISMFYSDSTRCNKVKKWRHQILHTWNTPLAYCYERQQRKARNSTDCKSKVRILQLRYALAEKSTHLH